MKATLEDSTYLSRGQMYILAGLLGILALITAAFGFAYKLSETGRLVFFQACSWGFLICLIATVCGIELTRRSADRSFKLSAWVTPAVIAVTLLSTFYFWLPTRIALASAVLVLILCSAVGWSRRNDACIALLLLAGFLLCCYLVYRIPIDRDAADMLPLMADADHFLLSGKDPYAQTYSNLFFYLPVQWLIYLPPVALGTDPRLINLASFAFVGLLTLWLVRNGRLDRIALLSVGVVMLSRSSVEMIVRGQVWPFWALVMVFAAASLSPGIVWAAVLLGVLLATQQPVAAIAVLLGIWLLFKRGIAPAFRVALISGCVFAAIMVPWLVLHPSLLFDLYIGIQREIIKGRMVNPHGIIVPWDLLEVSLLDLLKGYGLGLIRPALLVVSIGAAALYLAIFRGIRLNTFMCLTGVVYVIAISLNVQVFKHYYYPGLLLIAFGIAVPRTAEGIGTALPRQSAQRMLVRHAPASR